MRDRCTTRTIAWILHLGGFLAHLRLVNATRTRAVCINLHALITVGRLGLEHLLQVDELWKCKCN